MTPADSAPPPSPPPIVVEPAIAGFWRRVFGNLIDSIVVGGIGASIGYFYFDYLATLGLLGRAIGFGVTLLYFVPLNSRLTGGRTLGKFLVKTRVVARDGNPVGLSRSLVRYVILALPFFFNGAPVPQKMLFGPFGILLSVIVFGLGGSIVYLLIFNRRTRQALHDLAAGTYVVQYSRELDPVTARMWPGHLVVVCLIVVASMVTPLLMRPLAKGEFFKPMLALQERIEQEPEVKFATVTEGVTMLLGQSGQSRSTLVLNVALRTKPSDLNAEADKIAGIVLKDYPRALQKDQITISTMYGFDIGIAHLWRREVVPHSVKDWQSRLAKSAVNHT